MILALDPSSSCVGFALMPSRSVIVEAGRLTPAKTRDPVLVRIESLGKELMELLAEMKPETVVIEIPSGHVNHGRNLGRGAGLSVYGMAVGYFWRICQSVVKTVPVDEATWTRGQRKETRTKNVALWFKQYSAAADPGGDVADAIGLGKWWFER